MPAVSLAEFRTRVLQAVDAEGSGFVETPELNRFINGSLDALYDKLVAVWEDYYARDVSITLTGTSLSLPTDFYKLLGVDVQVSSSDWVDLKECPWAERNRWRSLTGARPEEVRYMLRGQVLQFVPGFGTASVPASLSYIPLRAPLAADSDIINFPQHWEEWAVVHAGLKFLSKAERDTTGLAQRLALEDQRINALAPKRKPGEVERVADVDGLDDYRCPRPWRR